MEVHPFFLKVPYPFEMKALSSFMEVLLQFLHHCSSTAAPSTTLYPILTYLPMKIPPPICPPLLSMTVVSNHHHNPDWLRLRTSTLPSPPVERPPTEPPPSSSTRKFFGGSDFFVNPLSVCCFVVVSA